MEMRLTDATLIRRAGQNNAEAYFINNIGQTVFKEIHLLEEQGKITMRPTLSITSVKQCLKRYTY